MRSANLPQAIEGQSVLVIAKKIHPPKIPRPVTLDGQQVLLYPINVLSGSGQILVELTPATPRLRQHSQVNAGARVIGRTLRGGTREVFNIGKVAVGTAQSRSSSHSNQQYTTSDYTWLETVATFTGQTLSVDPWKEIDGPPE